MPINCNVILLQVWWLLDEDIESEALYSFSEIYKSSDLVYIPQLFISFYFLLVYTHMKKA